MQLVEKELVDFYFVEWLDSSTFNWSIIDFDEFPNWSNLIELLQMWMLLVDFFFVESFHLLTYNWPNFLIGIIS